MPDILDDSPGAFALPDLGPADTPDFALHNEVREQLRILNQQAWGARAARGMAFRSILEDGAVPDDATDNRAAIQAALDAVGAAGGGTVLVPACWPGRFFFAGTVTIPWQVTLQGVGDRSTLRAQPGAGLPAIAFAPGRNRGGLAQLILFGTPHPVNGPEGIGIDLTGAQFLALEHFQVWEFAVGLRISDGVTSYSGSNGVRDFEINHCTTGVVAHLHANQCSLEVGRIAGCRGPNRSGIALDIHAADALAISKMAIENFDLGVWIRGRVRVSLRDIYWEADIPGVTPAGQEGRWMRVEPDRYSVVRMEDSVSNVQRSFLMGGSLEDAITNDEYSHVYRGAKRHHAAAPERNLIENGDFRRGEPGLLPAPWESTGAVASENDADFFTPSRSFDVIRTTNPNDGIQLGFRIPELPDYVTVMVRYKNISSRAPFFSLIANFPSHVAQFLDELPPDPDTWRVAALAVALDHDLPPGELGTLRLVLTADHNLEGIDGGTIRIDEVWAVIGHTAAPSRAHSHHLELLPEAVVLAERSTDESTLFPAIELDELTGVAQPPRGAIGALLGLRGQIEPSVGSPDPGRAADRLARAYLQVQGANEQHALPIAHQGVEVDRQVLLRGMRIEDGVDLFDSDFRVSYRVELRGWVLPS